jgi:WD40 repeat protein
MSSPEITFNQRYRTIYAIDERPGGKIWRCRDDQTGSLVLVAELPTRSDSERGELQALATQVALVQHEGLLALIDHAPGDRSYLLVCSDPGGHDLERTLRMRGGPLPEEEGQRFLNRMLSVVEQLHAQRPGLFLGDPTLTDFWVTERGEMVLLPFTLVRPIAPNASPYRAPELSGSEAEPSAASDMYAMGALGYHLLTGWAAPTAEQLAAGTPRAAPRQIMPSLSALTEQVLVRALQIRSVNRYQTAREMRVALNNAQMMTSRPSTFAIAAEAQAHVQPQPQPVSAPATAPVPPGQPMPPLYPPPPPGYVPGQPYAAPPQQPQQRSGMSTGCIVGLAVTLTLILGVVCLAAALLLTPLRGVFGFSAAGLPGLPTAAPNSAAVAEPTLAPAATAAPTPPLPTLVPIPLGDDAITLVNVAAITQTDTITTAQLGPIAYSPDGQLLAIGVGERIDLRNADDLESVATLTGHKGRVTSLAWSADSSMLASGASNDNDVRVWSVDRAALRHVLTGHAGWIRSLAFSPSGATLASGSTDLNIKIWDAQSGLLKQTLQGHTDLLGGVAFSPDGSAIASASRDGSVRLWDVAGGQERSGFSFQTGLSQAGAPYWTTGIAFSPDGSAIAVGATDANVYLLSATTGAELRRLSGHTDWVVIRGVTYAPDGSLLYTAGLDGTVRIWDPTTGAEIALLDRHRLGIFSVGLHPDGKVLATASDQEGILYTWDLTTDQPTGSLRIGQGVFTGIAFSPNSELLALSGINGLTQLRDVASDLAQQLPGTAGTTRPLAFISDEAYVSISDEGKIVITDAGRGDQRELDGFDGTPLAVAASRDGKLIAAGGTSGTVLVWDVETGDVAATLETALAAVPQVSFSYSGEYIAAGGPAAQPQIEIWEVSTKQRTQTLSGPANQLTGVAFQPGGSLIAATSLDGTLRLWDVESGLPVRTADAPQTQGWFTTVAFSPDGTMLATGGYGGALQLWDVGTGQEKVLHQLSSSVVEVGFSPDGVALLVSDREGAVRFFRLAS